MYVAVKLSLNSCGHGEDSQRPPDEVLVVACSAVRKRKPLQELLSLSAGQGLVEAGAGVEAEAQTQAQAEVHAQVEAGAGAGAEAEAEAEAEVQAQAEAGAGAEAGAEVSIQSLLNEHPIQNEPGHEKETGKNDAAYSEIIRYENISVAVVKMLKNTPDKFKQFRPQMRRVFLRNVEKYLQTLEAYKAKDGTKARSPIWNFQSQYRTAALIQELEELTQQLKKEEEEAVAEGGGDQEEDSAAASSSPRKRARSGDA
ncbi:unnamed protein product [Polarella glacialis]|uniref:Uncharacterized protein n=1 Tax=Polarella glacialis TaxID=89957 RepID=A0A813HDJ7_POLGL|nr:unnamed protein product [Polarella glacialis]